MSLNRILFICRGNIHRSVVAEHLARQLLEQHGIPARVWSRGIQWHIEGPPTHTNLMHYPIAWNGSRHELDSRGIDISKHTAQAVTTEDVADATQIIVMDKELLNGGNINMHSLFPEHTRKMMLFTALIGDTSDIEDCGDSSPENRYADTIREIDRVLQEGLLNFL